MSALDLARWQFGITTVYHFIFVPLTLGLSILVASMQTAWVVKQDPGYLRMTKFFGALFLINFAMGGHGCRAGIPVRHELVRLFTVRGRCVRRAGGLYRRMWEALYF